MSAGPVHDDVYDDGTLLVTRYTGVGRRPAEKRLRWRFTVPGGTATLDRADATRLVIDLAESVGHPLPKIGTP